MKKYLSYTLSRLSKERIMSSFNYFAFFLLVSTQVLFGAKDEAASTTTMEVYNDGTKQLVCYTGVPGLASSDKYLIEVKSAATDNVWVPLFTHKTYNRQQELSDVGDPYAVPPVGPIGWASVPKISGTEIGHITRTGIRNYLFHTGGWSHSYANIEMTPGTPVDVQISSVGGFQIDNQPFYKAAVYPPLKAGPASVVSNKVRFTITNPAQIVIDINGNMDDSNKALDGGGNSDIRHTVSLFANPIMVDKPLLSDTTNVVAVEPGTLPSNDLGTKTTMYFKPGVHNLGVNFKVWPGKHYYIPGDAIVYGAFNNYGVGGGQGIKMYGYGTISGGRTTHPDYVAGADQELYKGFYIENADNAEINGICIADPAFHSVGMPTTSSRTTPYVALSAARWTKVISWRGNGDGIGNVELTEDCFLRTNDDSAYIKGSKYRCTFWKDTSAAVFHMSNIPDAEELFPIVIEDCDLIYNRTLNRAAGSVFNQRGQGDPGLRYIDLTVRNFRIHDKLANRAVFNMSTPSYSGIKFENISMEAIPAIIANDPGIKNTIYGSATDPWFGGLTFKNVTIGNVSLTKENFGTYFKTNAFVNYLLFDDPRNLTLTTVADATQGSVTRNLNQATYLEMSPVELTAVPKGVRRFLHWSVGSSVIGTTNPLTVWMTDNKTITANFAEPNLVDPVALNIPISDSWTVLEGVSSITIQAWGGGGAGGSAYSGAADVNTHARGGGGAGGSYASSELPVQPGDLITYSVGAGGAGAPEGFTHATSGASGGVTSVQINGTTVSAVGGPGGKNISISNDIVHGSRGSAPVTGNTGNLTYYGGNGYGASGGGSGSGGGSAGAEGNGGHALSETEGGLAGSGGGAVGGNGHNSTEPGRPGGAPGAGGSGAGVRNVAYNYRMGGKGGDGKIILTFNTIRHTLNRSSTNGTITTEPSTGPFISGRNVTVTANADLGFAFANWSGDLSGSVNPTTIWMDGNKSVTANFTTTDTYTLTTDGGTGEVILNPPGGTYNPGTVVTVTAKPNLGFAFANWSGNLTGSDNSTTITMDGNKSVTANYITTPIYTLTTAGANGSVTLNPPGGTYNLGTVVTVTATPSNGYVFSYWDGALTGALDVRTITMDGHKSVTANFLPVPELTVRTGWVSGTSNPKVSGDNRLMTVMVMGEHNGDVSATGVTYGGQAMIKRSESTFRGSGRRTYAAMFTLGEAGVTAATSGTIAVNWSTSPSEVSAVYSVLLAGVDQANPVSDTAESALGGNTINTALLLAGSGDLVVMFGATEADRTITFNNGFTKMFESNSGADATGGFKFGVGADETPSFSQAIAGGNMVLCAMVVKKAVPPTFSLVTTAGINGAVAVNPPGGSYAQGTVVTVTATPNSDSAFINWSGDLAGSVNPTSFTMNSNRSVTANFTVPNYTLTTAGNNGNVTLSPPGGTYPQGTVVTVTAAPNSGFAFRDWSGDLTGSVISTTITMDGSKNVTANFVPTYTLTIAGINGTVTLNPPGGTYGEGTVVTVTAVPNSGLYFINWSGDLTGSVNPTNVTINGNRNVIANFAPKTWDGGGTDNNWSTAANWLDNVIPTAGIDIYFGGNVQNTTNKDLPSATSDIVFTNNGDTGRTNGFVLNGNSTTAVLVRQISTTASSSVITDTINFNMTAGATRIHNPGTNHHLTFNGNIIATGWGLIKNGNGILTLSGNNTYSVAAIAIQQGAISVSSIADSGFSNLGTSNFRIGNGGSAGTLIYTGNGSTTARTVQIGNSAGTGGATISANGTNGGTGLKFTGPTFNTLDTDSTTNARTLTLSGSNTDDNTISGTIRNAKTSGALRLTKEGLGTWILSGANTYTGTTTISGGTLQIGAGTDSGSIASSSSIVNNSALVYNVGNGTRTYGNVISGNGTLTQNSAGGTLTLSATNTYTGATNITSGRLTLGANNVLPNASAVSIGAATLDAATFTDTAGTLTVTAAATINLGSGAALQFADSSAIAWPGTLNIVGDLAASSIRFGASSGGLTVAQLGKITVNGTKLGNYSLNSSGLLINSIPVATAQSVTTAEDTAKVITLAGSDEEGTALTYTIVTLPASGTLSGTAPNVTYTPATNYNGAASFTFKVNDGTSDSASATVSITVTAVNDAPVATAQSVTTAEDTALPITLAGSDVEGSALTYTIVTPPTNGTLSGTVPNVTYTPTANYNGTDSFTFKVNDGTVDSVIATVSLTVTPVNDAPVAVAQSVTTAEDTALPITLAGIDVDLDTLTYTIVTSPANGTLSGTAPNVTYTPTANYNGADSFTFKVNDGTIDSATATVSITVTPVNDVPVAVAQSVTTAEDTAKAITLAGTDVENSALTYTIVTQPTNGTLSGTAPNVTFTPASNFNGATSFTFKVNDGTVDSTTATVSITITAVNDAPVFATNPFTTANASEGAAYTEQTLAGKAADVDAGDTITYSKVSGPAWLAIAANGALSGTPPTGSAGLNSFVVRATDSTSATADAALQITVVGLPLPWVATDIGTGMLAGSTTHNAGTFTQAGSGVIGSTSDKLRFTYQTLTGDGEIIAKISALQSTGNSSRVGVMIRDTLATNSKQIFMGMTGSNAYRWDRRITTGGSTTSSNSSTGTVPNTWLRLVRSGTTITAYKSTNGTTWTTVGSITGTSFASTCYIGLAVGSGSDTTLNTSQFSNLSVTP